MNLPLLFATPGMAILFKWTGLLALGWTAHGVLRRRHARWRLILWRGILGLGLALPLAHFLQVPGLKIPIDTQTLSTTEFAGSVLPAAAANAIQPAESAGQPPQSPGAAGSASRSPSSFHALPLAKAVPWESILLLAWAVGCGCGAFRLCRLQLQLFRLRKETCRPSPDLQQLAKEIRVRLQVRREVDVQISDAATSPFLCGVFKPAILVPRMLAQQLSQSEMAALLSHEMAHLRQHDLIWCVAWRWMKAVWWFHPLVWKVPAVHNLACEQEADRAASGQLAEEYSYSQLLARLALRVLALPALETKLTLNGSSQIARRLNHLEQKGIGAWSWRHSAAGFGLVGLLFLMTAGCEFSKTNPAGPAASTPLEFKEVLVVVQDEDGQPIEGATILPDGFRVKGIHGADAYGWNKELFGPPVKAATDREGRAYVKYPVEAIPEEKEFTGKLIFSVSHPEFATVRPQEYSVDHREKPIRLARGIPLEISGYFGADHQPVTELVPNLSEEMLRPDDWQKKENGKMAFHKLSPGGHLLQLMGRLPSGEIVYSEGFAFTAAKGKEYHFALELKPGIRLEGRIDGQVPRPVKNGRVLISVRPKEFPAWLVPEDAGELFDKYGDFYSWKSYRTISEDGSFVFESVPPGEADVVALGDGFVSKSIGQIKNRIAGQLVDGPAIGIPQPFALAAPITRIEVVTEPTATLELTAKTKQGKPVAGANIYLSPNVMRMGGILGVMRSSSEEPFRTLAPIPNPYFATTDTNGVAVIRNVPAFTGFMGAIHPQFQVPLQEPKGIRNRFIRIKFTPGTTNKLELILEPKGKDYIGSSSRQDSAATQSASGLAARRTGEGNAQESAGPFEGQVSGGVSYVPGPAGQAFQFNGDDTSVDFGNSAGNFGRGDFTIAFWMKTDSRNPHEAFLGKRLACGGMSSFWEIQVGSQVTRQAPTGFLLMQFFDGSQSVPVEEYENRYEMFSSRPINDGQWHHIAWVRQSSSSGSIRYLIYVDGALDNSKASPEAVNLANQSPVVMGQSVCQCCDGTQPYSGAAADLQIFSQALSTEAILTIYVEGKAGVPSSGR